MRRAFTLVELLVVIGIVSILMSLTLVAVFAARRSSERLRCQSNVKQLALATQLHLDAHGHLPTGGWSGAWVGLPGRGFGPAQPGGWAYNILPYLEEGRLHSLGAKSNAARLLAASAERLQTPVAVFLCPWRRDAKTYDIPAVYAKRMRGSLPVAKVAKCDYAMNSGDQYYPEVPRFKGQSFYGPSSLDEGDSADFLWPRTHHFTGVSFLRSAVRTSEIRDGTSKVYLLGEKYLPVEKYETGDDHGDDWSLYTGFQDDIYRSTNLNWRPSHDTAVSTGGEEGRFGSPHDGGFHMAMCDGSVHFVSFDVEGLVHKRLGSRADGQPATLGD
jgi:prepilin-type N-terminal cleavage/methylation domain-containing protein/prepilin-type processing-associated H-X9-DG protein